MKHFATIALFAAGILLNAATPQEKVQSVLSQAPPETWRPSGITREFYLDLAERIVRIAAAWVDADGAVIDPYLHQEWGQTSSRFASSCAVLVSFGRCEDLKETLYRVMDHTCAALKAPDSTKRSPDFWMRELAIAWQVLDGIAPADRRERWRRELAAVVPQKNYRKVADTEAERARFSNWVVYSSSGESMRESFGIGGPDGELWGNRFFDAYVRTQLARFNDFGMYRDPGDPVTYDITTRLQLEIALKEGYRGTLYPALRARLDDGIFSTLLLVSPSGMVPFGGRSAAFHYQEAMVSALCELAAARWKTRDLPLSMACKRQAHLSALAVKEWILREDRSLYHLKNQFDPASRHGCDSYGYYSVYSLLCASTFVMAARYADDSIAEAPCPAELGNFSFSVTGSFEKAFLNCAGNYAEFDLRSSNHYDGAGLGRVFLAGVPFGILPAMPCARDADFIIAPALKSAKIGAAIAPEWQGKSGKIIRLAEFEGKAARFTEIAPGVAEVSYEMPETTVLYRIDLRQRGAMTLEVSLRGDFSRSEMVIPVLESDGKFQPVVTMGADGFDVASLCCRSSGGAPRLDGFAVNRNGKYRLIKFPMKEGKIVLHFRPAPALVTPLSAATPRGKHREPPARKRSR